jgi:hypothetical protein
VLDRFGDLVVLVRVATAHAGGFMLPAALTFVQQVD